MWGEGTTEIQAGLYSRVRQVPLNHQHPEGRPWIALSSGVARTNPAATRSPGAPVSARAM